MRLLLDAHVVLWWLDGAERLSPTARAAIADGANDVLVSAATLWELSIKQSVGKLHVDGDLRGHVCEQSFDELPVTWAHAAAVRDLPLHHRDPFDRLLVAQAQVEGLTVVTSDGTLGSYGIAVLPA